MADRTPAFNPPMNTVPADGKDALIVKVEENSMEWAARKSTENSVGWNNDMTIKHVPNGR